jgi:hypothetical protein
LHDPDPKIYASSHKVQLVELKQFKQPLGQAVQAFLFIKKALLHTSQLVDDVQFEQPSEQLLQEFCE